MAEIVLAGADLVLPDRVVTAGTLVVEGGRIAGVRLGAAHAQGGPAPGAALHGHVIVPGFVDAHVHGVDGVDLLQDGTAVRRMAARLPRYGVTAFSPTSMACAPAVLERLLDQVKAAREATDPAAARVLPAHVEGPFLHHEYSGAQPARWLRQPSVALEEWASGRETPDGGGATLRVIERCAPDVGVVTLAPEVDGALRLIRWLGERGIRTALGHSAAGYDEALAAIAAGASRATHLFNRMPPLGHREPGLAGAALQSSGVVVELIADGVHLHPAIIDLVVSAKGASRVLAVTDGTPLAGDNSPAAGHLGEQPITATNGAARLPDGRLAGSIATMDCVFRTLVGAVGLSLVDAAAVCASSPSRALGVTGGGALVPGAAADFVVLDRHFEVVQTYVGGELAYARGSAGAA